MIPDSHIKYIAGRHDLLTNSNDIDTRNPQFKSRWLEPQTKAGASMLLVKNCTSDPYAFTWPLELNHHIYGKEDLFPMSLSGTEHYNLKTVIENIWQKLGGKRGMRPPVQIVADGLNDFVYETSGRSLECALAVSCAALFSQTPPLKRFFITGLLENEEICSVDQIEEKLDAVRAFIDLACGSPRSIREAISTSNALSLPLHVVIPAENKYINENNNLQIHWVSNLDDLLTLCFGKIPVLSNFYNYDVSSINALETDTYYNGKHNNSNELEHSLQQKIDILNFRLLQLKAYRCSVAGSAKEGMSYYMKAEEIGHRLAWEKAGLSRILFYSRMISAQRFLFESPEFLKSRLNEMKSLLSELINPIEIIHFSGSISLGYVWLGQYSNASKIRSKYLKKVVQNYELDAPLNLEFARSRVYMALSEARAGNPGWIQEFELSKGHMAKVPDREPYINQKQNQLEWNQFNYLYCLYLIGDFITLFDKLNDIQNLINKIDSHDYRHIRLLTFLVECYAANGENEKCPPLIEKLYNCVSSKDNYALTILPHLAEISIWVHFKPDENPEINIPGQTTSKTETHNAIDHIRKKVSDIKKSFPPVFNLFETEFEQLYKPDTDHKALWRKVIRRIPW